MNISRRSCSSASKSEAASATTPVCVVPRKKALLARIEKLTNAVKFAREQANAAEATDKKLGKEVFEFLFGA